MDRSPNTDPVPSRPGPDGKIRLKAGTWIRDNVELRRPLGEGGMGVVWVAHHHGLDMDVAVKVIHQKWSVDDPEFRARFAREATTAAQLDIAGVARTLDFGEMPDGRPYIVMDLLRGEDLLDKLEREEMLPLELVADILAQVGETLDAAHALGIVHRDVKPDNLFLCDPQKGQSRRIVKLLDFGIAKQVELPKVDGLTTPGRLVGTPDYLSPERISNAEPVTKNDDLWALAVVAYQMVTGQLPFEDASHLGALCAAIHKCEIRPPSELRADLPPEIDAWFAAALNEEPFERMASGGLMARTFAAAIGVSPEPVRSRSNAPMVAGGVALVVALCAAVVLLSRDDEPTTMPTETVSSVVLAPNYETPCPAAMKQVARGTFQMGEDEDAFPLSMPKHEVVVDAFCLDTHEVTLAKYTACVEAKRCEPADDKPSFPNATAKQLEAFATLCNWGRSDRVDHPVNCVDWHRAAAYCKVHGQRLPTEAEWELAARGTDGRMFPWGNDAGNHMYMNAAGAEWANWLRDNGLPEPETLMYEADDGHAGTAKVGLYPRAMTQAGHLDMVGNVWEWTHDWYAPYGKQRQVNPTGPDKGDRKVIRGGGFNGERDLWLRPAARYHQVATASVHAVGFRCAADVAEGRPTP